MFSYFAAGATDIGMMRSKNEDAYLVKAETGVLALADGMGGPPAGEVASALFVETVGETFGSSRLPSADAAAALLQKAFRVAHKRLITHVANHPEHLGLGCTAELLLLYQDRYLLGHLGDSRVYLFREGKLARLTGDHSLVQQMVDGGAITREQAQHHPMKNVLLRVLSADTDPAPELIYGRTFPGDLFLLCSDGLTEMLEDAAIEKILSSGALLTQKAELLIESALSAGGSDNVTVVLCQVQAGEAS